MEGEYDASNHSPHTCSTIPDDCPLERCGCTPGEGLSCDLDQLVSCGSDGISTTTTTCALGCSTEPRCLKFEPSNDLGSALAMAQVSSVDVVLPAQSQIDTDTGLAQDNTGASVAVPSVIVDQVNGSSIRAFIARSFTIDGAKVIGSRALALVAAGDLTIRGTLDASADGLLSGPGADLDGAAPCSGGFGSSPSTVTIRVGAGGAGNATNGATGGDFSDPGGAGGASVVGWTPLRGGCVGGRVENESGQVVARAGGGGGAVQLVSLGQIVLTDRGLVHVGGGGGEDGSGGGSGGLILLEAPVVAVLSSTSGVAANGGSGAGCGAVGADATADENEALSPRCTGASAGNGATGTVPPEPGQVSNSGSSFKGGGGGAAGRLRIVTRAGSLEGVGDFVLSAHVTMETLQPR